MIGSKWRFRRLGSRGWIGNRSRIGNGSRIGSRERTWGFGIEGRIRRLGSKAGWTKGRMGIIGNRAG